ncbi:hypothetical protein C8R44DRAFT_916829 [Mycena epipterygia]|nr:hypothetical protein C8R44DRAFT_916829 [Mycena epipterygia]
MDPDLSLDGLARFPLPLRRLATSAAANGSIQALCTLVPSTAMSQRGPLLAVFYPHLDPAGIPTAAALDASLVAGPSQTAIRRAFLSLAALPDLPAPPSDTLDQTSMAMDEIPAYVQQQSSRLPIAARFEHCDKLVACTPGVRVFVATAWVVFLDLGYTAGLTSICHFVYNDNKVDGMLWNEEYMEGSGDTFSNLASMVVRHIRYGLDTQPMTATEIFLIAVAIKFIADTADFDSDSTAQLYEDEFLAHGLAGAVTEAICGLNPVISDHAIGPELLDNLLRLLSRALMHASVYLWVTEALKAGLLRAVATSMVVGGENIHQHLEHYLTTDDDPGVSGLSQRRGTARPRISQYRGPRKQ